RYETYSDTGTEVQLKKLSAFIWSGDVKKAPRKELFKYELHADEDLFEETYGYMRQYYRSSCKSRRVKQPTRSRL
ncbi:MAG: hypothetical protein ACK45Y_02070, partial [Betaproteobacteria bacterium]